MTLSAHTRPLYFYNMAENNGWVKVYRSILDKGYYKKSHYVHLWLHILLKASHGETEFMWNGKIEKLEPGQFVTGRNSLSSDTGISPSTVEDILNVFESEQQIRQQKNNKFRLLTVLNWKEYQDIRQQKQQQSDSKPTSSRHLADTFKNVKNERIKELKNTIPPTIDELREYIKEKNYNINPEKFMAYYESNGWMVGRNKMKSWKAALVTWSHSGYNKPKQSRSGVTMISNRTETKDESIKILKELIAESKDEKEIADYKKMLGELEHEENK